MRNRDQKARMEAKLRKENREQQTRYSELKEIARVKHKFLSNLMNGRYWLARCNMLAEQIDSKNIREQIDGITKTEEFARAEYASFKLLAIDHMREAHFLKEDLLTRGVTQEELDKYVADYYEGAIIREKWEDDTRVEQSKAGFVPT